MTPTSLQCRRFDQSSRRANQPLGFCTPRMKQGSKST
jgi:hypothetical protein